MRRSTRQMKVFEGRSTPPLSELTGSGWSRTSSAASKPWLDWLNSLLDSSTSCRDLDDEIARQNVNHCARARQPRRLLGRSAAACPGVSRRLSRVNSAAPLGAPLSSATSAPRSQRPPPFFGAETPFLVPLRAVAGNPGAQAPLAMQPPGDSLATLRPWPPVGACKSTRRS